MMLHRRHSGVGETATGIAWIVPEWLLAEWGMQVESASSGAAQ